MMLTIFLILLFFYTCCFLPVRLVVQDDNFPPDWWDAIVYCAIGWCFLSLCSLMLLRFGITNITWLGIPPLVVFIICARRNDWSIMHLPALRCGRGTIGSMLALVLFAHLGVAQTIVMGMGTFPTCFFNVDTPYYLEHVFSLLRSTTYPPESLSNAGYLASYHYGVQNMAALLCQLSGLPPHKSLFWVVAPLLLLATFAAALRLGKTFLSHYPPSLFALVVLFCPVLSKALVNAVLSLASTGQIEKLLEVWQDPQLFGHGFQMFGTQMAIILFLTILWCLNNFYRRNRRLMFVLCLVLLLVTKSAWFVSAVCGAFAVSIYQVFRNRDFSYGLNSLAGLLLSVVVFAVLPSAEGRELAFGFGYYFMLLNSPRHVSIYPLVFDIGQFLAGIVVFFANFVLPIITVVALCLLVRRYKLSGGFCVILSAMFIAPLVFVNVTVLKELRVSDVITTNTNLGQVCSSLPFTAGVLLATAISALYTCDGWVRRKFGLWVTVLVLSLSVSHQLFISFRYLQDPENGHEYASNVAIGDVLQDVPVEEAVLVTNHIIYHTSSGVRRFMQPQIPALFGHQCYACNFKYQIFSKTEERLEQQSLLAAKQWSPQLDKFIAEHGWTHLLIHKVYSHPEQIPYPVVTENNRYIVYDLRSDTGASVNFKGFYSECKR